MDKEKVIRGLERCLVCNTSAITSAEGEKEYRDCEYTVGLYCRQDKLLRDALELLKEHGAVAVHDPGAYCPKCGWMLYPEDHPHHCGNCGQAVKWNENP